MLTPCRGTTLVTRQSKEFGRILSTPDSRNQVSNPGDGFVDGVCPWRVFLKMVCFPPRNYFCWVPRKCLTSGIFCSEENRRFAHFGTKAVFPGHGFVRSSSNLMALTVLKELRRNERIPVQLLSPGHLQCSPYRTLPFLVGDITIPNVFVHTNAMIALCPAKYESG